MLHTTTVESVHCTRDVQKELGVRGHDLLKLMLSSYSCSSRAVLYSSFLAKTLIPPYVSSQLMSLIASIFMFEFFRFAPWLNWNLFYRIWVCGKAPFSSAHPVLVYREVTPPPPSETYRQVNIVRDYRIRNTINSLRPLSHTIA